MNKKVGIIKRVLCLSLIFLLNINVFAAVVSDNDGSAFITKAEFDALKENFISQVQNYNDSIDRKIDGAIAQYLGGIQLATYQDLENMYSVMENEAPGGKILWSSQTTCDYNKAQYTNLGYKLDVLERYINTSNPDYSSYGYRSSSGLNHEGIVFDWPIKNIVTFGGEYQMTDDKASINFVGLEYCFNQYHAPLSNYFGYYPQSWADGDYVGIGRLITTIGSNYRLSTTYSQSMMWLYDGDCEVITSNHPYYLIEPNNTDTIYTYDNKPGYKTFNWPNYFKSTNSVKYSVRSPIARAWTQVATDMSWGDAWKDIDPDDVQIKHHGTDSDFDYANNKNRMHVWGITHNLYPWIDLTRMKSYSLSNAPTTYHHPGAVFFTNYGDHVAVNSLTLKAPKDKYGIYLKMSEGFPVLKMQKNGTFQYDVKTDKPGVLTTYNIGTGGSTHTTTLVDTRTLSAGTLTKVSAFASENDVIILKFLPSNATDKAKLDVLYTSQSIDN